MWKTEHLRTQNSRFSRFELKSRLLVVWVRYLPWVSMLIVSHCPLNIIWKHFIEVLILNGGKLFEEIRIIVPSKKLCIHKISYIRSKYIFGHNFSQDQFQNHMKSHLAVMLSSKNSVESRVKALLSKKLKTFLNVSRLASLTSDSKSFTCNSKLTMTSLTKGASIYYDSIFDNIFFKYVLWTSYYSHLFRMFHLISCNNLINGTSKTITEKNWLAIYLWS